MLDVRPSPIAGTWYEGDTKTLAAQVDEFLAEAKIPELTGKVMGIIAPHAGHRYSGAVAAHAFLALRGLAPDLVGILSPYHNLSQYPLITTSHQAYSTPLGNVEVDADALKELQNALDIPITPIANDREHALEIELPFLQRVLKNDFKLLPLMIRSQEPEVTRRIGEALARVLTDKNVILVASTDLSHFYDQETASALDAEMLARFTSLNPDSIFDAERTGKGFACGHTAVAACLWACKAMGAHEVKILKHATSGDVTGDYSSVVGYGAGVILGA